MKPQWHHILFGILVVMLVACSRQEPEAQARNNRALNREAPTLNYHALVIGIGDYSGTGWPQLGTARADADAMGDLLQTRYGFNVKKLTGAQATRGNILRELDELMQLTANDAALIYFAGHGFYDAKMDEGYWIPHGAKRTRRSRPAKEDWLWNTSISRIVEASPARHILLIADTCYGGSLFRGEDDPDKSGHWYQRAMTVPSRYLITSGNLEPVLDSGIRHSVFAQEILNYLEYCDQDLFSASDIAVSIRAKVSQLTGQLVRMGPLASPAHAGGEFVFVHSNTPHSGVMAVTGTTEKPVFRGAEPEDRLQYLASQLENYSLNNSEDAFVRPRILACVGPTGSNPEETAIIRNRLHESLNTIGGCILVEREAFETILQEVELGRSRLADRRAAMEIGKLLPASLILFGEIIPIGQQKEIHIRVVDTETSRVLRSTSVVYTTHEELISGCQTLAEQVMKTVNQARPLLLPATQNANGTLEAGWGKFHGARIGDTFEIITREAINTIAPREIKLGMAYLLSYGEEHAEFQTQWNNSTTNEPPNLWLKATL